MLDEEKSVEIQSINIESNQGGMYPVVGVKAFKVRSLSNLGPRPRISLSVFLSLRCNHDRDLGVVNNKSLSGRKSTTKERTI